MSELQRTCTHHRLAIANGAALTAALKVGRAAGGLVRIPSAWTAADLAFHVAEDDNTARPGDQQLPSSPTYALLRDKTGAIVRVTSIQAAEAGWYELPAQVLMAKFVKLQSTNTASSAAVNQGAERELIVILKS